MNKKILSLVILVDIIIFPTIILAASIQNPLEGTNDFGGLLCKIATGIGELIAVLGTIMFIVSGILYLTSAGSPERINTAKKALVYAIVGLAIALASASIVEIIQDVMGGTAGSC